MAGGLPYQMQNTGQIGAQPATVTVNDLVRQALSLGIVLPDFQANEYCETDGEERLVAFDRLCELGAFQVNIEHAIDLVTEDGEVVLVDHPETGSSPIPVLIRSFSATYNGKTGANTQSSVGWYWPPELEDVA